MRTSTGMAGGLRMDSSAHDRPTRPSPRIRPVDRAQSSPRPPHTDRGRASGPLYNPIGTRQRHVRIDPRYSRGSRMGLLPPIKRHHYPLLPVGEAPNLPRSGEAVQTEAQPARRASAVWIVGMNGRPPEWSDPPGYDRKLGRMRTPSDDFYDHRKLVLERITQSLKTERRGRRR